MASLAACTQAVCREPLSWVCCLGTLQGAEMEGETFLYTPRYTSNLNSNLKNALLTQADSNSAVYLSLSLSLSRLSSFGSTGRQSGRTRAGRKPSSSRRLCPPGHILGASGAFRSWGRLPLAPVKGS